MGAENGSKTDSIKRAASAGIEAHREEIENAIWSASSSVTIIVKLRQGKPFRTVFKTEAEGFLLEGA